MNKNKLSGYVSTLGDKINSIAILVIMLVILVIGIIIANTNIASAANQGDVLINEIFVNPTSGTGSDWYELLNSTSSDINLSDWTLDRAKTSDSTPLSGILPANGLLVFTITGSAANNTGDLIQIKQSTNSIFTMSYGDLTGGGEPHSAAPSTDQVAYISNYAQGALAYSVSSTSTKGWFNNAVDYTCPGGVLTAPGQVPPTLSSIATCLAASPTFVTTNMGALLNPSAASDLYFEKSISSSPVGRITFAGPLNLTDQNTVTYLKSIGEKMQALKPSGEVRVGLDTATASAFSGVASTVKMYGVTSPTRPALIVRDNTGTPMASDNVNYPTITPGTFDAGADTYEFTTNHFTSFETDTTHPTLTSVAHNETAKTITFTYSEPVQFTAEHGDAVVSTSNIKNILSIFVSSTSPTDTDKSGTYSLSTRAPGVAIASAVFDTGTNAGTVLTVTYTGNLVNTSDTYYTIDSWVPDSVPGNGDGGYDTKDLAGNTYDAVTTGAGTSQVFTVTGDTTHPTLTSVAHNETAKTITLTYSEPVHLETEWGNTPVASDNIKNSLSIFVSSTSPTDTDKSGTYSLSTRAPGVAIASAVFDTGTNSGTVLTITYTGSIVKQTNTYYVVDSWVPDVNPSDGGFDIKDVAGNTYDAVTTGAGTSQVFTVTGVDTIAPTVTKIGNNSEDVTIAIGATATLTFNEALSSAGKTAVQNALTAGADKVITYGWNGGNNILTITGNATATTTFANDVMANVSDTSGNFASLLLIDSALATTQTVPATDGSATVDSTTPEVVVTDPTKDITVTISSGTTNPVINVKSFIVSGTGTIPAITITAANANNTVVAIPNTTTITSTDSTWDGTIVPPTITTVTLPTTSGVTKTLSTAIEVGFSGTKLSFDKAVRILIPNQAGKRAGHSVPGGTFDEITSTCSADTQTAGDALASVDGDCKIDVGSDLVIWTKHFTTFAAYTQTTNSTSGGTSGAGRIVSTTITPDLGCRTGNIYNTSTGALCNNNTVLNGCINGNLFNIYTGQACVANSTTTTVPTFPSTGGASNITQVMNYNFGTTNLKNGSTGEPVKELQRFLNKVLNLKLVIDGKLGPKTVTIIKQWQKANGLVSDGIVGTKTKAIMNSVK